MVTLRPYQIKGQQEIWNSWATHDILMFVLATGGGKTVTFVDVAKQLLGMGKRVMFIAHREELIDQIWAELYANRIFAGVIKGSVKPNTDLTAQVASIQTLSRRDLNKFQAPDLIIIDEGHHVTPSNSYSKVLAKWTQAKVLIVTATPYRLDGTGFTKLLPNKETKLILNRTRFELQNDGYLVPFRYFICSIPDMSNVRKRGFDYDDEEATKAMEMAPIVESYLEHAAGETCVTFAITTAHSRKIVDQYLKAGVPAEHVDANTDKEERAAIFQRFRDRTTLVLVNVGIATEGTDIPGIQNVQLARPTMSLALVEQMLGRGARTLKGTVDDPTIDTPEKRKAAIETSAKPYCRVLDNAGVLIEHVEILDGKIDWEYYFKGRKRAPKPIEDEIEIITYVMEDEDGKRTTTRKIEEVEGMRLVEVTRENKQKVVNIKSLKEFDKLYAMARSMPAIKKKGWFAIDQYINYCKKNSYLINEECWQYLEDKLVTGPEKAIKDQEAFKTTKYGPMSLMESEHTMWVSKMKALSITAKQLKFLKTTYAQKNS